MVIGVRDKMSSNKDTLNAGIFLAVAMLLAAVIVLFLGQERELFSSDKELVTAFNEVGGLAVGAPVRLGGITVGRVTEIGFDPQIESHDVQVKFTVREDYFERVKHDTIASIKTQGLLGDKYLGLSLGPGLTSGEHISPGDTITGQDATDFGEILQKADAIINNTVQISQSIKEVLDEVKEDTLKNISDSASGIANIAREIESGSGLMHRLFYSKEDADKIIGDLKEMAGDLADITNGVKQGDGFLNSLIFDPQGKEILSNFGQAASVLSETATRITAVTEQIQNGNGLLNTLIYGDSEINISEELAKTAK